MIESATGNLLTADADALINTVNTVGVMGKGIALQFRRAYPAMFADYKRACEAGEVEVGRMHVWPTSQMTGPKYVINFPTKRHWRGRSELGYVEAGLRDLTRVIEDLEIHSIAVPPLGAGNGGLDWSLVRPLIMRYLGSLPDTRVLLFEPGATPPAREMTNATSKPALTVGRAALISILARYITSAVGASLIEVQKLMYFLQASGELLRLNYARGKYGPYADNLRHVLSELEGHYLVGYGDGSARVMDAEPIEVLPEAVSAANAVLDAYPETAERIERVLDLVEGFDSMYGVELLATVHWAAVDGATDSASVVRGVQEWSQRKRGLFTERHIEIARQHLIDKGWLGAA